MLRLSFLTVRDNSTTIKHDGNMKHCRKALSLEKIKKFYFYLVFCSFFCTFAPAFMHL